MTERLALTWASRQETPTEAFTRTCLWLDDTDTECGAPLDADGNPFFCGPHYSAADDGGATLADEEFQTTRCRELAALSGFTHLA